MSLMLHTMQRVAIKTLRKAFPQLGNIMDGKRISGEEWSIYLGDASIVEHNGTLLADYYAPDGCMVHPDLIKLLDALGYFPEWADPDTLIAYLAWGGEAMTKNGGMKIDYTRLGAGVYDMLNDKDRAVVSYGMIPVDVMSKATDLFREKIAKAFMEGAGWDPVESEPADFLLIKTSIKEEVINGFQRDLTVAILAAAKAEGNMPF